MTETPHKRQQPLRVLIASRIFSPEPAAASFRLAAVERALINEHVDVTVLTTVPAPGGERGRALCDGNAEDSAMADGGSTIKRWGALRDKTGYVRGYLPYMSFDIPLFFRLLVQKRPSVILVEPPPTTGAVTRVAAFLRHVPYVWYAADIWSDATEITGAPALIVNTLRTIERFAIRGASGVIAVSDGVAARVADLGGRNIAVIPNGIDTDTYSPNVPPLSKGDLQALGVTGPYFVYAGTASEWQGAGVFAEAMKKVCAQDNNLQVVFVGQGTQWEDIRKVAAELYGKYGRKVVVQVPPKPPEWVAKLLAGSVGALVSIVPGKGYDFAYPTKVLAALAAGKPVIYAGRGPAAQDIVDAELGMRAAFDAKEVALAMREIRPRTENEFDPSRLRQWVMENRSMEAMGHRIAAFLIQVARTVGQK